MFFEFRGLCFSERQNALSEKMKIFLSGKNVVLKKNFLHTKIRPDRISHFFTEGILSFKKAQLTHLEIFDGFG